MGPNNWSRGGDCESSHAPIERSIGLATLTGKGHWLVAMRWRRRVEAALGGQLTFTQWLILDAMAELIAETNDAINQNEIAARVELGRATVSQVMRLLERKGLVDRGISATGPAWRIWLTDRATALLAAHAARIEAASR